MYIWCIVTCTDLLIAEIIIQYVRYLLKFIFAKGCTNFEQTNWNPWMYLEQSLCSSGRKSRYHIALMFMIQLGTRVHLLLFHEWKMEVDTPCSENRQVSSATKLLSFLVPIPNPWLGFMAYVFRPLSHAEKMTVMCKSICLPKQVFFDGSLHIVIGAFLAMLCCVTHGRLNWKFLFGWSVRG